MPQPVTRSDAIPELVEHFRLDAQCHDDHTLISYPDRTCRNAKIQVKWTRRKPLGQGAFGIVWLEQKTGGDTDHFRAAKEIRKGMGHQLAFNVQYARELYAMAKLTRHPHHFADFHGWYENNDYVFLSMEYFPHGDLASCIRGPVSESEAQEIVRQLLEGLQFIHEDGITHRDLKPQNIFVVEKSPKWWVKIGDFGISKRIGENGTYLHTAIGTDPFMAPEVLDEENVDGYTNAVDIWALGCVIYLLITWTTPFANKKGVRQYAEGKTALSMQAFLDQGVSLAAVTFTKTLLSAHPEDRPSATDAMQLSWMSIQANNQAVQEVPVVPNPERISISLSPATFPDSGLTDRTLIPVEDGGTIRSLRPDHSRASVVGTAAPGGLVDKASTVNTFRGQTVEPAVGLQAPFSSQLFSVNQRSLGPKPARAVVLNHSSDVTPVTSFLQATTQSHTESPVSSISVSSVPDELHRKVPEMGKPNKASSFARSSEYASFKTEVLPSIKDVKARSTKTDALKIDKPSIATVSSTKSIEYKPPPAAGEKKTSWKKERTMDDIYDSTYDDAYDDGPTEPVSSGNEKELPGPYYRTDLPYNIYNNANTAHRPYGDLPNTQTSAGSGPKKSKFSFLLPNPWAKRKRLQEQRRLEIEEYSQNSSFNPYHAVYENDGFFEENDNSGYRGWGTASSNTRKLSPIGSNGRDTNETYAKEKGFGSNDESSGDSLWQRGHAAVALPPSAANSAYRPATTEYHSIFPADNAGRRGPINAKPYENDKAIIDAYDGEGDGNKYHSEYDSPPRYPSGYKHNESQMTGSARSYQERPQLKQVNVPSPWQRGAGYDDNQNEYQMTGSARSYQERPQVRQVSMSSPWQRGAGYD